jgi:ubiquinone/menaquinone biosynthesis C-methylase UbiE
MKVDHASAQRARIINQFSRQSIAWSNARGGTHEDAIRLLLTATKATATDTVLDVACGTGQVVMAFAGVANHVTGIDLTPEMINRAQMLQVKSKTENIRWLVGDALDMPFTNAAFSLVTCRYALHHMCEPAAAVAEMVRVCRPGGRVALVDVITTCDKRLAYDRLETLRDPSHVRALTVDELVWLADSNGLVRLAQHNYRLDIELGALLRASFPAPNDEAVIRKLIIEDIGRGALGIEIHRSASEVVVSYPIVIIVGNVPG